MDKEATETRTMSGKFFPTPSFPLLPPSKVTSTTLLAELFTEYLPDVMMPVFLKLVDNLWLKTIFADDDLLKWAIAQEDSERLCRVAIQWGVFDFDYMLCKAAAYGNKRLCCMARRHGPYDKRPSAFLLCAMIAQAAHYEHFHICRLIRRWMVTGCYTPSETANVLNTMLIYFAKIGNAKGFRLARKWGATEKGQMEDVDFKNNCIFAFCKDY